MEEVFCPCCREIMEIGHCKHLQKWRKQHENLKLHSSLSGYLDKDQEEWIRWSCDKCLVDGKSIMAKPERQNYTGFVFPYLVYFDIERKCRTCKSKYVYTKEEQRFWYEDLSGFVWSRASKCLACRKLDQKHRQTNSRLSKLVKNFNEKDENSLIEIIKIYLELENIEKAKFYFSKLRKINLRYKHLKISSLFEKS